MAFMSGPVTFSRFRVLGGSPKRLDDHLLEKLRAHQIGKQRVVKPGDEEIGWVGGQHLLDRVFHVDKNVVLDCLHFGLRIDGSRVPPDLMNAYVIMEWESLAKSGKPGHHEDGPEHHKGNGNGNGQARLWKQAREAARRRAESEMKDGRFRRQKHVPMLWDTRDDVLYVGTNQPAVHERLRSLFRESFDKRLEPLTAGRIAYGYAESAGLSRTIENLAPSRFVTNADGDEHGGVYWSTNDPASRDYLGNEFLLWLWHALDDDNETPALLDDSPTSVMVVKRLTLDCPWAVRGKLTVTADGPARLPESRVAVATGKLPRSAGLILSRDGLQFEFALRAETFDVTAADLPKPSDDDLPATGPGARREYRVEQIRELSRGLDRLYERFLAQRLSSDWSAALQKIRDWLGGHSGRRQPALLASR